jgi:hypothetical protein
MLSTGLGRFRVVGGFGGDDEAVIENGREKLAANVDASPELVRRILRGFPGDVERLCVARCSELVRFDVNGGVSPKEYDVDAGSLPQGPFDEPNEPYNPDPV